MLKETDREEQDKEKVQNSALGVKTRTENAKVRGRNSDRESLRVLATWKGKVGCLLHLANQSKTSHVEGSGSGHYSTGMLPLFQQNQHYPTP